MIKKICFMVVAVLILVMATCFAAVTPADFTVRGISLGSSSYDDIVANLGEPKKKFEDEQGQLSLTHLSYPGLKIAVVSEGGPVVYMLIDNGDYKTQRGVKVGATPSKLTKEYGQPQKSMINGHVYYIYDTEPVSKSRLIFDMTDGYASKIIFTSMPLE
ncbi:hypothetical protein SDC9_13735 [bioreactor metagenome]|uniref:DUF4309 domain-containing protein n=1 Tax=bioreactor metagenome TaxID=1076179 RepID=A0A644TQS3_9ZZZZ